MVNHTMEDVVLLHLADCGAYGEDPPASYDVSVPGISDVVGVSEGNVAERVSLLSSLSDLKADGLIDERVAAVAADADDSTDGERNLYSLTDRGRERAERLRGEVATETVVVRNGHEEEVSLAEAGQYFGDGGMVRALSRVTEDGFIYLDEDVGERFVNREAELSTLSERLDWAADGYPQFAFVSGEAGIGKTTLVREFERRAEEAGFDVVVGRCQSDTADPYGSLRDALSGVPGGESAVQALTDVTGPDTTDEAVEVGEDREAVDARREAMFFEFTDRLGSLVADDPLVLFLDDLQWVSPGTLELLAYVARNLSGVPLLLVGTYRPEDVPEDHQLLETVESVDDDRLTEVTLDRFGHEETRGIVEWIAGTRDVPEEFVDVIQERTGGNPLFVTESVTGLVEEGTVDPDLGIYPDDLSAADVPEAVEATIDMRLGALDATSREVLEVGSVVGERVPWRLLVAATDLPEPVVRDRADILVGSKIWEDAGPDAHQFTSAVIRETVLDRMDEDRRVAFERTIATAIQDAYDDLTGWYAQVAEHYERAGDLTSALEFYRMAGTQAESVYAHRDAIEHYDRALDVAREVGEDSKALGILEKLGETYDVTGEFDEAIKHFEYVRDHTENPATRQRMYVKEANILHTRSDFEEALARVEEGLDVAGGEDADRAKLFGMKGWVNVRTANYDDATELMDEELSLAKTLDDDQLLAKAHHDRGAAGLFTNDLETAIDHFERAMDLWPPDHHRRGGTLNNMGIAYRKLGDLEAAADCYEESVEIAEAANDVRGKNVGTSNLSIIYAQLGDLDRAIEYAKRAREMSERIGDELGVAQALGNLGQHYSDVGQYEDARETLEQSIVRFEELGNRNSVAMVCQMAAAVYRQLGEYETAIEYNERGLEIAREEEALEPQITNLAGIGHALVTDGDPEEGLTYTEEAVSLAEEMGRPDLLVDTKIAHAECLREAGRVEEATSTMEAAVEHARELGDPIKTTDAHYELGQAHLAAGDVEAAREHVEEAKSIAADHDMDEKVANYDAALADME